MLGQSIMQRHHNQQETNNGCSRNYVAHQRCVMFLNFCLHKRIQSAVNLGHCCFLSATLIAHWGLGVLLLRANRLRNQANGFSLFQLTASRNREGSLVREIKLLNSPGLCYCGTMPANIVPGGFEHGLRSIFELY
jgi:hypothetical protein